MKKSAFAIEAAPSAIPPNPNIAAIMAMTKNVTDQRNMILIFILRQRLPAEFAGDLPPNVVLKYYN
jgi:hypothetical protein